MPSNRPSQHLRALQVLGGLVVLALSSVAASPARAQLSPEDEPIPDIVPTLPSLKPAAPTAAPPTRNQTTAKATAKPLARPAATARPRSRPAVAAQPAAARPTLFAVPMNPAKPTAAANPAAPVAPEDVPLEDVPIEDQPIPDVPAVPDVPRDGARNAVSNPASVAAGTASPASNAASPSSAQRARDSQGAQGAHRHGGAMDLASPDAPGSSQALEEPSVGDVADPNASSIWSLRQTFAQNFMLNALVAGLIVALLCSYLGVYVVLKRIVFVGVALAEVSSTGIALAILLGLAPLLGAMGFVLLGVSLLWVRWSPRRVPHDSFIGIIYSTAAALSVLLLAKSAGGETQMLKLLQGDILTVDPQETWQMLAAFALVAALHALFSKEFLLVSFDRDAASTLGLRAGAWDYLLFLSIGVAIAFSIRTVGVLVASTMLVMPAVSALLITNHIRRAWLAAPLFGLLPIVLGLHLSFVWDLPSSSLIVLLSFVLLLFALAWNALTQRG